MSTDGAYIAQLVAAKSSGNGQWVDDGINMGIFSETRWTLEDANQWRNEWIEAVAKAEIGSINTTLNDAAFFCGLFGDEFGDRSEFEQKLLDAVHQTAYDPNGPCYWKAEDVVTKGMRDGTREPKTLIPSVVNNVYAFPTQAATTVSTVARPAVPAGSFDAMFDEDRPGQPIPEDVVRAQHRQTLIEEANAWLAPSPLEPPPEALDPLALGPIAGPMAAAAAKSLQVPVDMAMIIALPVIATAGRGRYEVVLSEDGSWVEPLILCSTAVLASGERKSAANHLLTKPLRDFEDVVRQEMGPDLVRQKGERKLDEGRLEALKKAALTGRPAGRGQPPLPPTREDEEAYIAAEQAMALKKIDLVPRWIADDATPEAIVSVLNEQGGAIGIFSTEPGIFKNMGGRYSSNGGTNLETVLLATAGDPIYVDRKGDPGNPVHIAHPALNMTLAIQPGLLPQLDVPGFRDSGLLARFLWVLPEGRVGTRTTDEVPMPHGVVTEWHRAITALARDALESTRAPAPLYGQTETAAAPRRQLTLTPEAKARFKHWREWLEPQLHQKTGNLADVADWGSKLPGQVAKIAMALTLLSNPRATVIQEIAIANAITVGNGLISHVLAVFTGIHSKSGTAGSRPREVLAWLIEQQLPSFSVREVHIALRNRSWAHKVDAVKDALTALTRDNHVRQVAMPVGPKGGRPSTVYELNPAHLSQ